MVVRRKAGWAFNTGTGDLKPIGLGDLCVEENFHRVVGPNDVAHNRVELLFQVVDRELRRVQVLFDNLEDPDQLEFDDLIGLGLVMATQRMRTLQERRLQLQYNAWMVAQDPDTYQPFEIEGEPFRVAGMHTELVFNSMWRASDVLTTKQIEVWQDPQRRFMTCDAPVLVPFDANVRRGLLNTPYIIWPVSPGRVVALSENHVGEKAVMRRVAGREVGLVQKAILQGRELMILAGEDQRHRLPEGKTFRRRPQSRLRCARRDRAGRAIPAPGCRVELSQCFAAGPDVALCDQGLHRAAPLMRALA